MPAGFVRHLFVGMQIFFVEQSKCKFTRCFFNTRKLRIHERTLLDRAHDALCCASRGESRRTAEDRPVRRRSCSNMSAGPRKLAFASCDSSTVRHSLQCVGLDKAKRSCVDSSQMRKPQAQSSQIPTLLLACRLASPFLTSSCMHRI